MTAVLVTGGTGTLGRVLVPRLQAAGHDVTVLSRRSAPPLPPGAHGAVGDVRLGAGLDAAVEGAGVVVHAATSPTRQAYETEVEGTRRVAAAAARYGAHLIYVSIVGVDRHRYRYYRAKHAAEQIVAASDAQWSVLRATQFHGLLDRVLSAPVFVRTRRMAFQVVDPGDVADRLVEMVAGAPVGLAPEFGGPEVLHIKELARTRTRITGRRSRLVPVPAVGFLADFDAGRHLCPDRREGKLTWERWLQTRGRRRPPPG